jgi:hypothetical protein
MKKAAIRKLEWNFDKAFARSVYPHSIYKAYEIYAHKYYTFRRLGAELTFLHEHPVVVPSTKQSLPEYFKDFKRKHNKRFADISGKDFLLVCKHKDPDDPTGPAVPEAVENDNRKAHFLALFDLDKETGKDGSPWKVTVSELFYSFYLALPEGASLENDKVALGQKFLATILTRNIHLMDDTGHNYFEKYEYEYLLLLDQIAESIPRKDWNPKSGKFMSGDMYIPTSFRMLIWQIAGQAGNIHEYSDKHKHSKEPLNHPLKRKDIQNLKNYCDKLLTKLPVGEEKEQLTKYREDGVKKEMAAIVFNHINDKEFGSNPKPIFGAGSRTKIKEIYQALNIIIIPFNPDIGKRSGNQTTPSGDVEGIQIIDGEIEREDEFFKNVERYYHQMRTKNGATYIESADVKYEEFYQRYCESFNQDPNDKTMETHIKKKLQDTVDRVNLEELIQHFHKERRKQKKKFYFTLSDYYDKKDHTGFCRKYGLDENDNDFARRIERVLQTIIDEINEGLK